MSKIELSFPVSFSREANINTTYDAVISISFLNFQSVVVQNRITAYSFNYDIVANISTVDRMFGVKYSRWTPEVSSGIGWELINGAEATGAVGLVWHGNNAVTVSDNRLNSPDLNVASNSNFTILFDHSYAFEDLENEYYDGGVVELYSYNNSQKWVDIMNYTSSRLVRLSKNSSNPLRDRLAFGSTSPGFPALRRERIALGSLFANQKVKIRFRIGTDVGLAAAGWYISNVQFEGITNTPFSGIVRQSCTPLIYTLAPTIDFPAPVVDSSSSLNELFISYLFCLIVPLVLIL
eukprot:TRINITY_DN9301_c0_g1_i1.p1 TRINITY_DN9301_c0_g1~~TRINITY_DN9301_c0_g1_i1.p1  ORF type:complete len:307 (+),score=57.54 TRINITY_DN9301_c0_g1_i1:45-923(+)